jgi:FSR family fosmidomycin resistance protein-like MFS transporter
MRLLRQPVFLAVALGHFIVDTINSQTGLLLAGLSASLSLKNADIGLIATTYAMVGALSQPFFGWLADRFGGRWPAAGGVLWMATFFSLMAFAPGYWPIVWLIIGALGSGAFHPSGTSQAANVGRTHMAGRVATAASIFFLFGQGGYSFGPALGGVIVDYLGRSGMVLLSALALPIGLFAAWQLRAPGQAAAAHSQALRAAPEDAAGRPNLSAFVLLILLSGLPTWAHSATATFAPKFYHEQGLSATVYGVIIATTMGGSAVGGVIGGVLGDRWGRRRTVTLMLALAILPFYFFPVAQGPWVYVWGALAGLFNGAPHSILVTMAQRAMPGRAALASGLTLGFMFTAGALGAYVSGLAADRVGLAYVLQANAGLLLAATLLSLALRRAEEPLKVVAASAEG